MDAKIVVASAAALVIISGFFLAGSSFGGFFNDLFSGVGQLLHGSPLAGFLVSNPHGASDKSISMTVESQFFTLKPKKPVNITFESGHVNGFKGAIYVDYGNETVVLNDGSLDLTYPLQQMEVGGLSFDSFDVQQASFDVDGQFSAQSAKLVIMDFIGAATIGQDKLYLLGNVSSVKAVVNDKEWLLD